MSLDPVNNEFNIWRTRMGLTQQSAAEVLGLHLRTVQRYDGGLDTPRSVALACAYLEMRRDLVGLLFRSPAPSANLIFEQRRGDSATLSPLME